MPTIPLPVIANVYRVTFNWTESVTGQHAANILHFERAAGTASDVFNDLNANVNTNMWFSTVSTAKISSVDIIKLDGVSGRVSFPTTAPGWVGQATAGDFLTSGAYLIKFGTGVRGRSNRGRIFLPFLAEGQASNGTIPGAAGTAMTAAWNAFKTAMTAVPDFLVIASYDRKHSGASAHATIVNTITPELIQGTQARRQSRLR